MNNKQFPLNKKRLQSNDFYFNSTANTKLITIVDIFHDLIVILIRY